MLKSKMILPSLLTPFRAAAHTTQEQRDKHSQQDFTLILLLPVASFLFRFNYLADTFDAIQLELGKSNIVCYFKEVFR